MSKNILLVEYDESTILSIKDIFHPPAFEVVIAGDGETAKQLLRDRHFDLMITAAMLPRFHGFNLALALAQGPELLVLDEPTLGLDVVAKRAFLEALMYSNLSDDCTVIYCSHQMDEIERVADNLIILEQGELRNMSPPEDFVARVTYWVADIPFKGPDPRGVPGLLQLQRIDGLHHYLVLDQDERFAEFLRASGARSINSMPVSLDRAVNGFLAKNHATPVAA